MKKNKLVIVFVIILVVIIGFVLFLSKDNKINKFTFPKELIVENNTNHKG